MKDLDSSHVHSSWLPVLEPFNLDIQNIFTQLTFESVTPAKENIFRAFLQPISYIRCVIIGQDPYPTRGHAHGLAFSTDASVKPLPKSLHNIFIERESDLGIKAPSHGDLTAWSSQGVMLLNRVLTTEIGAANAHSKLGWQKITEAVAQELGARNVVAILWGKQAQELSALFQYRIESAHPSPLSSYRGFFGSKPFSRVNEMLAATGREPIDWTL
jgi:uracil-DNA glycosylase